MKYQNVVLHLTQMGTDTIDSMSSLEDQLKAYQRNIAAFVMERLEPIILPLKQFKDLHSEYFYQYVSFTLDPTYEEMRMPFMSLHASDITAGGQLAKRYDEEVIVPLLFKLKETLNTDRNEESATVNETVATQTFRVPTDNVNRTTDTIDCFIVEDEYAEEREKRVLLTELVGYRTQPFN